MKIKILECTVFSFRAEELAAEEEREEYMEGEEGDYNEEEGEEYMEGEEGEYNEEKGEYIVGEEQYLGEEYDYDVGERKDQLETGREQLVIGRNSG